MRILLIEDNRELSDWLSRLLRKSRYVVDAVHDGADADTALATQLYDLIILDLGLPGMAGLQVLKRFRQKSGLTPVIILTASDAVSNRVAGLDAGADDYLVKPFAFSELMARVNALARRPHTKGEETRLKVGDLEIDLVARKVTRGGDIIDLQPREFRLLEVLMRNRGRVVTRTMLLERVWSFHFDPKTSVVETHISRLRAKIDKPYGKELIHTIRGSGYTVHDGS